MTPWFPVKAPRKEPDPEVIVEKDEVIVTCPLREGIVAGEVRLDLIHFVEEPQSHYSMFNPFQQRQQHGGPLDPAQPYTGRIEAHIPHLRKNLHRKPWITDEQIMGRGVPQVEGGEWGLIFDCPVQVFVDGYGADLKNGIFELRLKRVPVKPKPEMARPSKAAYEAVFGPVGWTPLPTHFEFVDMDDPRNQDIAASVQDAVDRIKKRIDHDLTAARKAAEAERKRLQDQQKKVKKDGGEK